MKFSEKIENALRWCVLAAAVLFIGIGAARGEAVEVFHKAVQICLSCIGIG